MSKTLINPRRLVGPTFVGLATGTSDYVATFEPPPVAYATGQRYQVRAGSTSTGNIRLNPNGLGLKKVFKAPATQATTGDWAAGQWYIVVFDQTLDSGAGGFLMTGSGGGGGGGSQNISSVLAIGNDAGAQQIKNAADATSAQDLVTLSQMTAAITAAVTGLLDYRGGFSAAGGAWPSSGGSGTAGAVLKGDVWVVTTGGTLPTGIIVEAGDWLIAKIDTPGNTGSNWDVLQANVVLATSTVAGIMKLYGVTGSNTDGTMTQASILTALNLKSDALLTITPKTGNYTLAAAELTAINQGKALIMQGDGTGALQVPTNASVAFPTDPNTTIGVRNFLSIDASLVTGAGGTITGTNGTLLIPANSRISILEKTGTNTWILHNGGTQVTTWSTVDLGIVEESTQAEAEAAVTGAQAGSTGGLSQGRAPSELGIYYILRKFVTLAWTWATASTYSYATASSQAIFNASKQLVSNTVAAVADWITGTDNLKAVTVASFLTFRRIRQAALTVVPGTPNLLTINNTLAVEDAGQVATAQTANFTINWSNHDNLQYYELWVQINGTVVITMTNGTSGQPNIVSEDADLRYASKALTIVTTSAKWIRLAFTRQTTGTTGVFSMEVSTPVSIS